MSYESSLVLTVSANAILPDLNLNLNLNLNLVDWSDRYMVIPKASGSNEYGAYRSERTPHAREPMMALSNNHPCKTVVLMAASQIFKTQIAINWLCSTIHQAPSSFLWLMPTGNLRKRIAARIDKSFAAHR